MVFAWMGGREEDEGGLHISYFETFLSTVFNVLLRLSLILQIFELNVSIAFTKRCIK